jgi:hypothetical protein
MIQIQSINKQNIYLFLILIFSSILINTTYYFDHDALLSALVINNNLYTDENNLFYIIHNSLPSNLFDFLSFLIDKGIAIETINSLLTLISILFNLSGIYLICKFITSSRSLSILLSLSAILFGKNFGDIDYPTLMFSEHTNGLIAYSLSTFILGLLTIRNNFYAIFFTLILLSIHLVIGLWMSMLLIFFLYFDSKKKVKKNLVKIALILIFIFFYYLNFSSNSGDLAFEFNKKDYDNYFFYLEAHRTNYGNLKIFHYEYIVKSIILLILISLLYYFNYSKESFNKVFLKILFASILFSFLIYVSYKLFPNIYPEFIIRVIPQRFFLIHSIVGLPIVISIIYRLLKNFLDKKKIKKNYSYFLIISILSINLYTNNDKIFNRYENIAQIKNEKKNESIFWKKISDLNLKGYILTSNYLCKQTLFYSKQPLLFCFESLDYIPYIKKLASPTKLFTNNVLGVSYSELEYKNLGGIYEYDLKNIYENKNSDNWKMLKEKFELNTVIVPKNWNLKIKNLILNDKYKVYVIE